MGLALPCPPLIEVSLLYKKNPSWNTKSSKRIATIISLAWAALVALNPFLLFVQHGFWALHLSPGSPGGPLFNPDRYMVTFISIISFQPRIPGGPTSPSCLPWYSPVLTAWVQMWFCSVASACSSKLFCPLQWRLIVKFKKVNCRAIVAQCHSVSTFQLPAREKGSHPDH